MTFQMLMRGVDGQTSCVRFSSRTIAGSFLQKHVASILRIPAEALLVVTGTRVINPHTSLCASSDGFFPSCSVLLRLRGGKGGFGSLLRGAATKAGQKKTSNFDACRDMSGRRLRHVNAEKKLKEWKAQAKEREFEKTANDFLKKQVKQKEDESGCSQVIERFREETFRAREDVESAVAQGLAEAKKLGKRKAVEDALPSSSSKRANVFEIDTFEEESEDEREGFNDEDVDAEVDSDKENEDDDVDTEVDLDEGNENEDAEEGEDVEKTSEDENTEQGSEAAKAEGMFAGEDANVRSEIDKAEGKSEDEGRNKENYLGNGLDDGHGERQTPVVEVAEGNGYHAPVGESQDIDNQKQQSRSCEEKYETRKQVLSICVPNTCNESNPCDSSFGNVEMKDLVMQSQLDLCDYLHASDLEVFGLDRLKQELQVRGLKCGGSLAERAGRLFLLKTVSLEKLDRKHFSKVRV